MKKKRLHLKKKVKDFLIGLFCLMSFYSVLVIGVIALNKRLEQLNNFSEVERWVDYLLLKIILHIVK